MGLTVFSHPGFEVLLLPFFDQRTYLIHYTAFTSTLIVMLHLRPLRSTDRAGVEPC